MGDGGRKQRDLRKSCRRVAVTRAGAQALTALTSPLTITFYKYGSFPEALSTRQEIMGQGLGQALTQSVIRTCLHGITLRRGHTDVNRD